MRGFHIMTEAGIAIGDVPRGEAQCTTGTGMEIRNLHKLQLMFVS